VDYVLACLTQIQDMTEVLTLKARGKAISRAVDVAQILTKRFATDIKVKSVSIATEQVESHVGGGMSNVSSIEIKLHRPEHSYAPGSPGQNSPELQKSYP